MTVSEAISRVDNLKPNQFDNTTKTRWLSELDMRIHKEIILTHEHESPIDFNGYDNEDGSMKLLAEDPYSDLYIQWLFAKIDYNNGEFDRYANSYIMFNNAYADYANMYNRTHMPLQNNSIHNIRGFWYETA